VRAKAVTESFKKKKRSNAARPASMKDANLPGNSQAIGLKSDHGSIRKKNFFNSGDPYATHAKPFSLQPAVNTPAVFAGNHTRFPSGGRTGLHFQ
jgi:hypothetical protein